MLVSRSKKERSRDIVYEMIGTLTNVVISLRPNICSTCLVSCQNKTSVLFNFRKASLAGEEKMASIGKPANRFRFSMAEMRKDRRPLSEVASRTDSAPIPRRCRQLYGEELWKPHQCACVCSDYRHVLSSSFRRAHHIYDEFSSSAILTATS